MARSAGLVFGLLLFSGAAFAQADKTLEVHFISVGQADAVLVRCGPTDRYLLIDAADTRYPDSAKQFQDYLRSTARGGRLDAVIVSHAHADHIGSMKWVLENFQVGVFVDGGDRAETRTWSELSKLRQRLSRQGKLEYVNGRKVKAAELDFCPSLNVSLDVVSPWAYSKKLTDPNDRSVIVRLGHGDNSFLFVGDAHDHAEKVMLENLPDNLRKKLDVDVLKVGHHGSHTSSTAAFVMAVSPAIAVISSGRKDTGTNTRYKHPRYNTVLTYANWFKTSNTRGRFDKVRFPGGRVWAYDSNSDWRQVQRPEGLWFTTVDGTIVVQSDGKKLSVQSAADRAARY